MPIIKNKAYTLLCQINDCFRFVTKIFAIPTFNQFLSGKLKSSRLGRKIRPFESFNTCTISRLARLSGETQRTSKGEASLHNYISR